jgi:dTDP-4-amino-4,6-dideoxygalactose transaminase
MKWKVPLSDVDFDHRELEAVSKVVRSRWLTMGEETEKFERKFARFLGTKHAFALSSGTAALHVALRALGVGAGDEVILPSLTFVAAGNAVLAVGARPVFADIKSEEDLNVDPESVASRIGGRTKAVIVVHYGGFPCDMEGIMRLARREKVRVIEDAAHAPGASLNGRMIGTIGDAGCFSFFSNKNMTTGEGGMVVTSTDRLAKEIRLLRSHGMTTLTWDRHKGHAWSYDVVRPGLNYRSGEIQSAMGIVQLGKLKRNNRRRRKIAMLYRKRLSGTAGVAIPFSTPSGEPSYHLFTVLLDEGISREAFMEGMKKRGVQTSIHYPPVHGFTCYRKLRGKRKARLPNTEKVTSRVVSLPLSPVMREEDVEYVCAAAREAIGGAA